MLIWRCDLASYRGDARADWARVWLNVGGRHWCKSVVHGLSRDVTLKFMILLSLSAEADNPSLGTRWFYDAAQ